MHRSRSPSKEFTRIRSVYPTLLCSTCRLSIVLFREAVWSDGSYCRTNKSWASVASSSTRPQQVGAALTTHGSKALTSAQAVKAHNTGTDLLTRSLGAWQSCTKCETHSCSSVKASTSYATRVCGVYGLSPAWPDACHPAMPTVLRRHAYV